MAFNACKPIIKKISGLNVINHAAIVSLKRQLNKLYLTAKTQSDYSNRATAKSVVGLHTPIFKECLGAHSLALFLCLLLSMADRLQAPLGGRFSLSGGMNLFSVCHPIHTSVVDLNNQRGINHV